MALDAKTLEGKEIADDYVRTAGTGSRWGETWKIFRGSLGKIVLINILMLICFAPAVAVIVVRNLYVNTMGLLGPFNNIGPIIYPNASGLTENIYLSADLIFFSMLIACGLIIAIGLSGGAYAIKKLLNTGGKFSFKGFFHGIKICYFKTLLPVLMFLVFYFCCVIVGDWKDLVIANGGSGAGPTTAYAFMIIATVLIGFYCAWLLAVGVSYRLKFLTLLKTAFSFMLNRTLLPAVIIAAIALIPVWLYLIGTAVQLVVIISYIVFVLIGLSFILLVWLSFTQWTFDLQVTPNIQTEENKSNAKNVIDEEPDEKDAARELLAAGKSELIGKPILPIAEKVSIAPLGTTFKRADLDKISRDREKLNGEVSAYEQKHKSDPLFAEYNKLFAEREKALQTDGKKGKKKKISANNLLK